MYLWTAFTIGIIGSLHCLGMCGPIAMAVPYQARSRWLTGLNILQYHLGRVITYAILGGLIGLLGRGIFLAGMQKSFSIGAGVILLIMAIFSLKMSSNLVSIPIINRVFFWVKSAMGKLLRNKSATSILLIGMLNGLLPCGLVYMAIAGAIGTGSVSMGTLYMILFGLGTIPMLLGISLAGNLLSLAVRKRINKLIPIMVILVGIFFILRGLSLGIPYLSPPRKKIEKKFEKSLEKVQSSGTLNLMVDSRIFHT